jgi:predicted dehydrogenase/nucleoside-diphosphate-sugar epimerase
MVAVVDPVHERAADFATRWGIDEVFDSIDSMMSRTTIDAAHVLVPPPLHRQVAEPLLRAGVAVLLEKPMAQSVEECAALQSAAADGNAALRVNHNVIFHPAHARLRQLIAANKIGPVRHIECRFNLPLRQLGARQLGHWMFDSPRNLLLEQVVHPLSQIDDIVGPAGDIAVLAPAPLKVSSIEIHRAWMVSLQCERAPVQLFVSLGESYPSWTMAVVGDDGTIVADYLSNRVIYEVAGRYPVLVDSFLTGARAAWSGQEQAFVNFTTDVASTLKIRPRSDTFFRSMRGSIEAFHADVRQRAGDLSGAAGRRIVDLCERIVATGLPGHPPRQPSPGQATVHPLDCDVAVIGGTGFIGTRLVTLLAAQGRSVAVLARNTRNLPAIFNGNQVKLVRGDARNASDVSEAVGNAKLVVNLAHGGGTSRGEIETNLVGSARTIAEVCLAKGIQRLIFTSSIAALYLGDPSETVTGATPADPRLNERGDYARAKALAETELLELHRKKGLPVCILRPGIVVGDGGSPFHSGLGFYNREAHCMGWNKGTNPLPLVLVDEVAAAIAGALIAQQIDGKCYNVVGNVRLTAREYIAELAKVTGRPLRYHPQSVHKLYAAELGKACIKLVTGRGRQWPSMRDLRSRGLPASFDCSDAVRDLGWKPVTDRKEFFNKAFPRNGAAG